MKTVFSTRMVAHVWAQQEQPTGRNSHDSLFFKGRTIYSYRITWPLAYIHKSGLTIINTEHVSSTTSKHVGHVLNAIRNGRVTVDSARLVLKLKEAFDYELDNDYEAAWYALREYTAQKIALYTKSAARRKNAHLRQQDLALLHACLNTGYKISELINAADEYRSEFSTLHQIISDDTENYLNTLRAEFKEEIKAEKLRASQQYAEAVTAFRTGQAYSYTALSGKPTMLRLRGEKVETSRGAEFPVQDAIAAFPFILRVKNGGFDYVPTQGVSKVRLGHFSIDKVEMNGNVTAGCHYVHWNEIESLSVQLGLITTKEGE